MNKKQLFVYGASILAATLAGGADAQQADERYVQVAEIEIDPVQLDAYRSAVQEQIDAAIRRSRASWCCTPYPKKTTLPMSRSSRSIGTGALTKLTSDQIISRNTRRGWTRW